MWRQAHLVTLLVMLCYDRRRLPCFAAYNVRRFQYVTSCKTRGHAYNMLHGRLCHLLRVVMLVDCFILEAARCIQYMQQSGYDAYSCLTCAHRFLRRHPDAYGMKHWRLFLSIRTCYARMLGNPAAIAGIPDEWQPVHRTVVAPLYPTSSSDIDISGGGSSDMDISD
jgi:hypothetical protein